MQEGFRPVSHTPPVGFWGRLKFYGRMIPDLQILTIYRDLKASMPSLSGNVLDVGCGQSPYKHLADPRTTKYFGIDIADAHKFDCCNANITLFNGEVIPFESEMFSGLICTEVLEHVQNYQKLIDEMYRVMRKGGKGIITVPWSARCHYLPYDFFRYTPATLKTMFALFRVVQIKPRGTDVVTIVSKVIVLWFRNLRPSTVWGWILLPFWLALSPILLVSVALGHLSLLLNVGSEDDPLGYTIIVTK
jgi:2-polyprenyl-3-methyl-5-hydroxy-6-metoxy-1,4-benzoquinol methylase